MRENKSRPLVLPRSPDRHVQLEREGGESGLGGEQAPSISIGFWVASTKNSERPACSTCSASSNEFAMPLSDREQLSVRERTNTSLARFFRLKNLEGRTPRKREGAMNGV